MSIETILMKTLGGPLAKFLLKKYLSEPAGGVGAGLLDLAQKRITDYGDQREAQRQFERLGERIVKRLLPLFAQEARKVNISVAAVAAELAETLSGRISADFFLAGDLDPAHLTTALRQTRPVNAGLFSDAEIALYDRALEEAVRYVVQVASRLPKFDEAYASVSLQRLGRMSDEIEKVLESTQRIEAGVSVLVRKAAAENEHFTRYEADYRQAVMRNLDFLELFGADISPEAKRHGLSVAYISLNLNKVSRNRDQAESLPVESVLDVLSGDAPRLLIRGEAGSGKSTLFRWTAIQAASFNLSSLTTAYALKDGAAITFALAAAVWAKRALSPSGAVINQEIGARKRPFDGLRGRARVEDRERSILAHWRLRIPFLVRLRDCKDGQLPSPDDLPTHIASEIGNAPPDWVASILRKGQALVLLDGIDEVPNVHREQLRRAIEGIVGAYPDNYYLVSTRPTAVEEGWLTSIGFREAVVDPMSDVDRTLFIEKWHDAVGRELAVLGKADGNLPQIAADLIEQLPEHPPVARLATNPLLCSMICALHRERNQKLPESQAELCEAICHMLLHRRERESGLSMDAFPEAYRALTYPEKRAIVQDIAHYMVRNGESKIARERAQQSVADSLKQFPDRKGIDADELLNLIVERSGVLRETRPNEIDFIHNTLKEYLAAERFSDADDVGQLADKYADASWQPVILFSLATNRRDFATKVVQRVLRPHARTDHLGDEELRARRLFALRCRAAALHLSSDLITELDSVESRLFPPRSMADAEALASGGDTAIDYLRWRKRLSAREAAACIRTLRLIGTQKAERALRTFLSDSRMTVVSELAQAVNPLEILLVRNRLQAGTDIPDVIRTQIVDLHSIHDLDVVSLDLGNAPVTDLAPLANSANLQSLDLHATRVSDLSPLTALTALRSLILRSTPVADIAPLAGLTSLRVLDLMNTSVSDLAPLAGLTNLERLDLWGTEVSDIMPLRELTNLEHLDLQGTHVRDLTPLVGLTRLASVELWNTDVSDLGPLAGLTSLHDLNLRGTPVRDLAALAGMIGLRALDLAGTHVSDLGPLAEMISLHTLDLAGTQVSDLAPLGKLTRLKWLNLTATPVVDVAPLVNLSLTKLYISNDLDVSMLEGNKNLGIVRVTT